METRNKKRSSIMKKPEKQDDQSPMETVTRTSKRISFSGKRSIKEFLGDEMGTIWCSSYEETASGEATALNDDSEENTTAKPSKQIRISEPNAMTLRNGRVKLLSTPAVTHKKKNPAIKKTVKIHPELDKENIFTDHVEDFNKKIDDINFVDQDLLMEKLSPIMIAAGEDSLPNKNSQNDSIETSLMQGSSSSVNGITICESVDVTLSSFELNKIKFKNPAMKRLVEARKLALEHAKKIEDLQQKEIIPEKAGEIDVSMEIEEDLPMSESNTVKDQSIFKESINKRSKLPPSRQTILCNADLDVSKDESMQNFKIYGKNGDNSLEIEEDLPTPVSNTAKDQSIFKKPMNKRPKLLPSRQTILCNADLDVSKDESMQNSKNFYKNGDNSLTTEMQNESLCVFKKLNSQSNNRRTVLSHTNLDLSTADATTKSGCVSRMDFEKPSINRKTIVGNFNLDITEGNLDYSAGIFNTQGKNPKQAVTCLSMETEKLRLSRKTIFNQVDLDITAAPHLEKIERKYPENILKVAPESGMAEGGEIYADVSMDIEEESAEIPVGNLEKRQTILKHSEIDETLGHLEHGIMDFNQKETESFHITGKANETVRWSSTECEKSSDYRRTILNRADLEITVPNLEKSQQKDSETPPKFRSEAKMIENSDISMEIDEKSFEIPVKQPSNRRTILQHAEIDLTSANLDLQTEEFCETNPQNALESLELAEKPLESGKTILQTENLDFSELEDVNFGNSTFALSNLKSNFKEAKMVTDFKGLAEKELTDDESLLQSTGFSPQNKFQLPKPDNPKETNLDLSMETTQKWKYANSNLSGHRTVSSTGFDVTISNEERAALLNHNRHTRHFSNPNLLESHSIEDTRELFASAIANGSETPYISTKNYSIAAKSYLDDAKVDEPSLISQFKLQQSHRQHENTTPATFEISMETEEIPIPCPAKTRNTVASRATILAPADLDLTGLVGAQDNIQKAEVSEHSRNDASLQISTLGSDIEIGEQENYLGNLTAASGPSNSSRKTNIFNTALDITAKSKSPVEYLPKSNRKTILFHDGNDILETTTVSNIEIEKSFASLAKSSSLRKTILSNSNIDETIMGDEHQWLRSSQNHPNSKTIILNQTEELDLTNVDENRENSSVSEQMLNISNVNRDQTQRRRSEKLLQNISNYMQRVQENDAKMSLSVSLLNAALLNELKKSKQSTGVEMIRDLDFVSSPRAEMIKSGSNTGISDFSTVDQRPTTFSYAEMPTELPKPSEKSEILSDISVEIEAPLDSLSISNHPRTCDRLKRLSPEIDKENLPDSMVPLKSKRNTMIFNDENDMDVSEVNESEIRKLEESKFKVESKNLTGVSNSQRTLKNQTFEKSLDSDEISYFRDFSKLPIQSKRQTTSFDTEDKNMELNSSSNLGKCNNKEELKNNTRRTILFRADAAMDESQFTANSEAFDGNRFDPRPPQRNQRRTQVFDKDNDLEETAIDPPAEYDTSKINLSIVIKSPRSNRPTLRSLGRRNTPVTAREKLFDMKTNESNCGTTKIETDSPLNNDKNEVRIVMENNRIEVINNITNDRSHIESHDHTRNHSYGHRRHSLKETNRTLDKTIDAQIRDAAMSMREDSLQTINYPDMHFGNHSGKFLPRNSMLLYKNANSGGCPASETHSSNNTEYLCNLDPSKITAIGYNRPISRLSGSSDMTYGRNQFVNLSVSGMEPFPAIEDNIEDNIEDTRLSLVELSSMTSTGSDVQLVESPGQTDATENNVNCKLNNSEKRESLKLCRKCKKCRESLSTSNATIDSFGFDCLPPIATEIDWSGYNRLKGKPTVADVLAAHEFKRKSMSFEASAEETYFGPETPSFKMLWDNYAECLFEEMKATYPEIEIEPIFPLSMPAEYLINNKFKTENLNWVVNSLHMPVGFLEIRHKRIRTYRLTFEFNKTALEKSHLEDIVFNVIKSSKYPNYKNPPAIDLLLLEEMLLRTTYGLGDYCTSSKDLFTFLDHIHSICEEVLQTAKIFKSHLIINEARLRKDENRGIRFIEKSFKDTNIFIQVRYLDKISANDVTLPSGYTFNDDVHSLQSGLEFVRIFLFDPSKYIKQIESV